jgi:hypothetical protein
MENWQELLVHPSAIGGAQPVPCSAEMPVHP